MGSKKNKNGSPRPRNGSPLSRILPLVWKRTHGQCQEGPLVATNRGGSFSFLVRHFSHFVHLSESEHNELISIDNTHIDYFYPSCVHEYYIIIQR
jgi:hypothetical protein